MRETGKHGLENRPVAVDHLELADWVAQHRLWLAEPLEKEALRLALSVIVEPVPPGRGKREIKRANIGGDWNLDVHEPARRAAEQGIPAFERGLQHVHQ